MTTAPPASIVELPYEPNPSLAATGLRGFTVPLSPRGTSSLFTPPPWYFSSELLQIEFAADPAALARFLPTGFEVHPDSSATFCFAQWCTAAESDPRLLADPGRGQHNEAYLLIHAVRNGEPVGYLAFAWVTTEVSQVRGMVQGFPKKLGQVAITRAVELGRGGSRKAPGNRFAGAVSCMGERLVAGAVTLDRVEEPDFKPPSTAFPHVYVRLFPSLSSHEPAVQEISTLTIDDIEMGTVLSGDAELSFSRSDYEELHDIGDIEVKRGYLYSFAMTIVSGQSAPI